MVKLKRIFTTNANLLCIKMVRTMLLNITEHFPCTRLLQKKNVIFPLNMTFKELIYKNVKIITNLTFTKGIAQLLIGSLYFNAK
jgi:hypothetical protein